MSAENTDQHRIDRILVLEDRVRALEAAVPEDPWVMRDDMDALGYFLIQCYSCDNQSGAPHRPDCAWIAARGAG